MRQLSLDVEGGRRAALLDLFEEYAAFRRSNGALHDAADAASLRPQRWRAASATMYRAMWVPFAAFLAIEIGDVQAVTAGHVRAYLTQATPRRRTDLSDRYGRRLAWLLDQLIRFDAMRRQVAPNGAASTVIEEDYDAANSPERDPLPSWLRKAERRALQTALTLPLGSRLPAAPATWIDVRDYAMVALQAGGGLTPGEVRALTLEQIEVTRQGQTVVTLRGNGNAARRQVALETWAGASLQQWMQHRKGLPGGDYVFCSERGERLHKNSVRKACDAVLRKLGIPLKGGRYRLRYTYAMSQLAAQRPPNYAAVATRLGIRDIERFRQRFCRLIDSFDP